MHLQEVPWESDLSADAGSSGSQLPCPAVVHTADAGSSIGAPQPAAVVAPAGPAPVVEPAPVDELATTLSQAAVWALLDPVVEAAMPDVPESPKEAALHTLRPPAPVAPMSVGSHGVASSTAVAVSAFASSAVEAQHTIQSTMLTLAREIRKPKAYVGYCAFILMGLLKACQPCVWEGDTFIDLLEVFAPWAKERCSRIPPVTAVACTLKAQDGGSVALVPISKEHPLSKTSHFVQGIQIPVHPVLPDAGSFEVLYASLGVAVLSTVLDGDCAFAVMTSMLMIPTSAAARKDLRIEVSDYLMERIGEPWLLDVMVACQELRLKDVILFRSGAGRILTAAVAPAPAVAVEAAAVDEQDVVAPDDETFAAMRWVCRLNDDSSVLSLIRSLPPAIVEEQVSLYRRRDAVAGVAKAKRPEAKIILAPDARFQTRMLVAQRFHAYCRTNGIVVDKRLEKGVMKTFIRDHIAWKSKQKIVAHQSIRKWHKTWGLSAEGIVSANEGDISHLASKERTYGRSRALVPAYLRRRGCGAGRPFNAPSVRAALYEWFSGIRYAVDWTQLIAENRASGEKHLCRFPRELLRLKLLEFIQEYVRVSLLNGVPVKAFKTDSHWFKRWEQDYGLCMRYANRKYAVSRKVVKERMEIFWVNLFRLRQFIFLVFGYDPVILNFDQSPFHHNETGSQNKPTLAVRGSTVPVVEGNSDVRSRWSGNFMTISEWPMINGDNSEDKPAAECMFKAARDGPIDAQLQAFLRSRGFPQWFTVTVSPSGSYSELDIIEFLQKHLEPWRDGRRWMIMLSDDYSAHKTDNVWNQCWCRGYVRLCHGGGCTPVGQTPDTDLNQHVRHRYGAKESRLLLEKMRSGQVVPKLANEECMLLMFEVLSDPELHRHASLGFKKVGQSIDSHGKEDAMVCREAGVYWNEETTDNFPSMRPKIDVELAEVVDEFGTGGISWCEKDVKRLITAYPKRPKVDKILERLGQDFYHDEIHTLENHVEGETDAERDQEAMDLSSDENIGDDEAAVHVQAAVADEVVGGAGIAEPECSIMESAPLNVDQAEAIHKVQATIVALEGQLDGMRVIGQVRGVQIIQTELSKQKRKVRELVKESPAVADAFQRLRRAEEEGRVVNKRIVDQDGRRKLEAQKAIADRAAAVAELKNTKRKIQEMEGDCACRHAIKTFTLAALGEGSAGAGGAKARDNRFDVLDRLSRIRAGLSPAQRNDWQWFKKAWDQEMVKVHGAGWAPLFARRMQEVLDDERSNAFSTFMFNESCRVFDGMAALHVPGI